MKVNEVIVGSQLRCGLELRFGDVQPVHAYGAERSKLVEFRIIRRDIERSLDDLQRLCVTLSFKQGSAFEVQRCGAFVSGRRFLLRNHWDRQEQTKANRPHTGQLRATAMIATVPLQITL